MMLYVSIIINTYIGYDSIKKIILGTTVFLRLRDYEFCRIYRTCYQLCCLLLDRHRDRVISIDFLHFQRGKGRASLVLGSDLTLYNALNPNAAAGEPVHRIAA
jgi:hypothetical protein